MDQVRQQGEGVEQPDNQEAALPGAEQQSIPETYNPLEDLKSAEQPVQPEQSVGPETASTQAAPVEPVAQPDVVATVDSAPAPIAPAMNAPAPVVEITTGEHGAILGAGTFELKHTPNAGKTSEQLNQAA